MPIFEYKCEKCNKLSSFLETGKQNLIEKFLGKKCPYCKSRNLKKQYSSFATYKNISQNDLLNDISKVAPIKIVPEQQAKKCGVDGKCPYQNNCNS